MKNNVKKKRPKVKLIGEDGNAYSILGRVKAPDEYPDDPPRRLLVAAKGRYEVDRENGK